MPLRFEKITTHKKRFLDLFLLADEQESTATWNGAKCS